MNSKKITVSALIIIILAFFFLGMNGSVEEIESRTFFP